MKKNLTSLLSIALIALYATVVAGCGGGSDTPTATTTNGDAHDHDHEGHDHDHDEHDHPPHGPHGGHLVQLVGGAEAEWSVDNEQEKITVYVVDADLVTKVEMVTDVDGTVTPYEFTKTEVDGETVYELVSPELLTAVKMGESVQTKLVLTTDEGEQTAPVQYHAH